jgi:hypothetical protein
LGGEGQRRKIWSMYFLYMYEYRTLKPMEVILRKWGEVNTGGVEPN